MLTLPNQEPVQEDMELPTDELPEDNLMSEDGVSEDDNMAKIQMLDNHINSLPEELQAQFEDGFRKYDDLPELFGMLMPDAYEYFKLVQQGVRGQSQQPQQDSPAASPMAPPAGEQAQTPLLGGATQPAKDTPAFTGLAQ